MIARAIALCVLAWRTLAHYRLRTALAIIGIALAVLTITLLAGTGLGVIATGEAQFDRAEGDLWMTGEAAELMVTGGGGFENTIHDSHNVSAAVREHEGVAAAGPLAFQRVVVGSTDDDNPTTVIGTGVPSPTILEIEEGEGFSGSDTHYAGGSYDGELSNEIIIDRATADRLDVEIGDTVHVGGSERLAREHEYEVVGISSTIAQFLGAPTVVLHLSELQTLTGTALQDPAAMIVIETEPDADIERVQADLSAQFPDYEIRTDREQLTTVVQTQATVIGGGVSLVILSVVAGFALTANVLAMLVYHQRRELAALTAIGIRPQSLGLFVVCQGALLGILGGALGVLLTPLLVPVLNWVGKLAVGFDGLVVLNGWVLLGGFSVAVMLGVLASALAVWRLSRLTPVERR